MSYHTAATHDDASKFRKRMQERVREAEKRRALNKLPPAQPMGVTLLVPKARAK